MSVPASVVVFAALFTVQVLSSGNTVITRAVLVDGFDPAIFMAIRVMICIPILTLSSHYAMRARPEQEQSLLKADSTATKLNKKPNWRIELRLFFLGLCGITANLLCYIYGLELTDATTTGITYSTTPVITALVAISLKKERFSLMKLGGIMIAFAGALIMFDPSNLSLDVGIILLLLSSFCYSLFIVLQRSLLESLPSYFVLSRCFIYGAPGIFIAAAYQWRRWGQVRDAPYLVWLAVLYASLLNTVVGYWLMSFGIRHSSPMLAGLFINFQPVIVSGLAAFTLNESIDIWQIMGAVCIISGVVEVSYCRYREEKEKAILDWEAEQIDVEASPPPIVLDETQSDKTPEQESGEKGNKEGSI